MSTLWSRLQFPPSKPEGWPERDPLPEVSTTDPWPVGFATPKPATDLHGLAVRNGWLVRLGYSRGPERAVRVGTYKMVESVGVWAAPHPVTGWRFCAVYAHTLSKPWSWSSVTIWRPGQLVGPGLGPRFTEAMLTDLKEWINAFGDVGTPWYKAIQAREEAKATAARVAARNRPKTKKEGSS